MAWSEAARKAAAEARRRKRGPKLDMRPGSFQNFQNGPYPQVRDVFGKTHRVYEKRGTILVTYNLDAHKNDMVHVTKAFKVKTKTPRSATAMIKAAQSRARSETTRIAMTGTYSGPVARQANRNINRLDRFVKKVRASRKKR